MTSSSRQLAVETLLDFERGGFADRFLQAALADLHHPIWAPRATALAYGSLRLLARLDFLLAPWLSRPLDSLDPIARNVLRVGAYELLFSPRSNPPATVHSLVDLAKAPEIGGHIGLGQLVNAVLRRLAERADDLRREPRGWSVRRRLIQWWSLPEWCAERWLMRWGAERALEQAEAAGTEPHVHLRVNRTQADRDTVLAALADAGVAAEPSQLHPLGICLAEGAPGKLPGYREGWFAVQDEASLAIAELCAPRPGERVIDLCAAPGSKATQLAEMGAQVIACDVHHGRLSDLRRAADRLGLEIETIAADGRDLPGRLEPADCVLLDAPCSGSGTLARRPDLRWRLGPERLAQAVELQRGLLAAAARLVRPGGRLIYSTCSLEREENEDQMEWLARAIPELAPSSSDDQLVWPVAGRHDGFFMAARRKEA